MAEHIIIVGETNYLPLMAVERLGFIYDTEDIEEVEYEEPAKVTNTTTLPVAGEDLCVDDSYAQPWDKMAVETDGVKYLTLDTLRETSFVIMPCDLQEVEF